VGESNQGQSHYAMGSPPFSVEEKLKSGNA